MRFSEIFSASVLVSLAAAHGNAGIPKIVGLTSSDVAALKSRNILGGRHARAAHPHGSQLQARQGGNAEGRCGKEFGCATCAEGYCCSIGGYCGQGSDYCQAPDSQFEYGPAADANTVPPGGSTRNTVRTKSGSVLYGGDGIYVCTKPGQIAITYDDGPYEYTPHVLDLFASYGFKATFFVTGINLSKGRLDDSTKKWSAMITRMIAEGHQVASHTWSHQDLSAITSAQRYDQMVRLEMALSNIMGKFPTYMRPPFSSCSSASGCPKDMEDLGYHISYFDLDTDDYNNVTPELQQNAKDKFYNQVNPSNPTSDEFLAIAHDIHYQTAYNLTAYMLDYMVKKGYTGVTMGECLGDPAANWYRTPAARVASTSSFSAPACASTSASKSATASGSRTSSGAVASATAPSLDSSCGPASGFTCLGFSVNGVANECCSQYNYCGNTEGHCGTGCQAGFGKCGTQSSSSASKASTSGASASSASASKSASVSVSATSSGRSATPTVSSPDASCGAASGYTCVGFAVNGVLNECCSQYGWCGNTEGYCGTGCQAGFGKCGTSSSSAVSSSASVSKSSSIVSSSASVSKSSSAVSSSASISKSSSVSSSSSRAASSSVSSSVSKSSSVASSTASSKASSSSSASRVSSSASSSVAPSTSSRASSTVASSSRVSSASSVASSTPTRLVSTDGSCGSTKGYTCLGSGFGDCCSQYGWCGSTTAHCGTGCQPLLGKCTSSGSSSSSRAASSVAQSSSSVRVASSSTARSSSTVVAVSSPSVARTPSSSTAKSSSAVVAVVSSTSSRAASSSSSKPASSSTRASSSTASSTRSSSAASASATIKSTPNGTCGSLKGYSCIGYQYGECCSKAGWCGSSILHCAPLACDKAYGKCNS